LMCASTWSMTVAVGVAVEAGVDAAAVVGSALDGAGDAVGSGKDDVVGSAVGDELGDAVGRGRRCLVAAPAFVTLAALVKTCVRASACGGLVAVWAETIPTPSAQVAIRMCRARRRLRVGTSLCHLVASRAAPGARVRTPGIGARSTMRSNWPHSTTSVNSL